MATITPTPVPLERGGVLAQWTPVTENDTPDKVEVRNASDLSVQIAGTFGGATVLIQGSNDGTNWATLNDAGGTAVSKTAAALVQLREKPRYIRPSISGGTGQSLTITLLARRGY